MAKIEYYVGGQFGDEGKGKVICLAAEKADVVVRASGGANAGHTVVNERGEFGLHLIPSGIFNPRIKNILGPGVLLGIKDFSNEADSLLARGVSLENLRISDRATVLLQYHQDIDKLEEQAKGKDKVGTTGRGIGPACEDRDTRTALMVGDLLRPEQALAKLTHTLEQKKNLLNLSGLSEEQQAQFDPQYYRYLIEDFADKFGFMVCDSGEELASFMADKNARIICEGAQGTMLDKLYGTYPYVTSSPCTSMGLAYSAGLPTFGHNISAIGVFKAYLTRVGSGPLPTRAEESVAQKIREKGNEYGTTTGRPRDVAWFDGVMARKAQQINGFTEIALTKLDTLAELPEVNVCVAYRLGGKVVTELPSQVEELSDVEPIYEILPGWPDISHVRDYWDLPLTAQDYVSYIENMLEAPVTLIGVGKHRDAVVSLPVGVAMNKYCHSATTRTALKI